MTFSIIEYITTIILIVFNLLFWKRNFLKSVKKVWIIVFWFLLFAGILPILSIIIEIIQVNTEYEIVDGFNLLYLYFRFPTYWIIGWIELLIAALIGKHHDKRKNDALQQMLP